MLDYSNCIYIVVLGKNINELEIFLTDVILRFIIHPSNFLSLLPQRTVPPLIHVPNRKCFRCFHQ